MSKKEQKPSKNNYPEFLFNPAVAVIKIMNSIDKELAEKVFTQICEANRDPEIKSIMLVLSTFGGGSYSSLAIFDACRLSVKPVNTLVIGPCHSAGAFLLKVGQKRYLSQNSTIIIHLLFMVEVLTLKEAM